MDVDFTIFGNSSCSFILLESDRINKEGIGSMRKGISGKIVVTAVTLILTVLALIFLWKFLRINVFGMMSDTIERVVEGFADAICSRIPFCSWFK